MVGKSRGLWPWVAGLYAPGPLLMTDPSRMRTFWLRLCALAAFSCVLLIGRGAHAAAPMCGERGESIAAPPVGMPTPTSTLHAERPCDALTLILDQETPQRRAPRPLTFEPAPDRAMPVVVLLAPAPEVARIAAGQSSDQLTPNLFARSLYRPPRV